MKQIHFDPTDQEAMNKLMDEHGDSKMMYPGTNENGEEVYISIFNEKIVTSTLSDEKFIFNLMNFPKHDCFEMNDIFDILERNYKPVIGVGKDGGYHAQILMGRLLRPLIDE